MLSVVQILLLIIGLTTLLWWWRSDRRLRRGRMLLVRLLIGAFVAYVMGGLLVLMNTPFGLDGVGHEVPRFLGASVMIWSLFILPASMVLLGITGAFYIAGDLLASRKKSPTITVADSAPDPREGALSRRGFLAFTSAALPPMLTFAGTSYGLDQMRHFRIRKIEVPIAKLPSGLDGLTIAHVSDTHIGQFNRDRKLMDIATAVTDMDADLVVHTGDLINNDIRDMDFATEMLKAMKSRWGIFACEGNHDVLEGRENFEKQVVERQLPVLLDQTAEVRINRVDIQFMGIRWHQPEPGLGLTTDQRIYDDVRMLNAATRKPGAFPILLAHHPHGFDPAREFDIPLTLSGHTHGGQIGFSERFSLAALKYRYWSGLYTRDGMASVVSNGTGAWFPLRINVPAELVHLTLRRG
jgi:uncharacterized protein